MNKKPKKEKKSTKAKGNPFKHYFEVYKAKGKKGDHYPSPLGLIRCYSKDEDDARREALRVWNSETSGVKIILKKATQSKYLQLEKKYNIGKI